MPETPIFYLTFANHRQTQQRFLTELEKERRTLRGLLAPSKYCEAYFEEAAEHKLLEDFLYAKGQRVALFHFSGHASGRALMMEGEARGEPLFPKGLARWVGKAGGVKLVFLNACSTQAQIDAFHREGVPLVLATRRPVRDEVAHRFAERFYERLVVRGDTLLQAFHKAQDSLMGRYETPEELYDQAAMRDLLSFEAMQASPEVEDGYPYLLSCKQGMAYVQDETIADWQSPHEKPAADPGGKPDLYDKDLYLLCNRHPEREQVKNTLRTQLRSHASLAHPQAFLIHGQEDELPDSLMQCLQTFDIPELVKGQLGTIDPLVKSVALPSGPSFLHEGAAMQSMEDALGEAFGITASAQGGAVSRQAILRRWGRTRKLIWVNHRVPLKDWHATHSAAFLAEYLNTFWGHPLAPNDPRVILTICLSYPRFKPLDFGGRSQCRAAVKCLNQLAQQIPWVDLLPELRSVDREDVESWRVRHFSIPQHNDLVQQLFGGKKKLPMRPIERHLSECLLAYGQQFQHAASFTNPYPVR